MSLYYEKGFSQTTICRMTGLSASALRVRLFRARGSLVARALRA
jgi:DNA-directed RNA polymerase specialized sigma24 family protein